AAEECDDIAGLSRLADSLERDGLPHQAIGLLERGVPGSRSRGPLDLLAFNEADADRVHGDVVPGEFLTEHFGECEPGRTRNGTRGGAGRRGLPADGGDIDYPAAAGLLPLGAG